MNADLPPGDARTAARATRATGRILSFSSVFRGIVRLGLIGFVCVTVTDLPAVWGQATRPQPRLGVDIRAAASAAERIPVDVDISEPDIFQVELRRRSRGDHRQLAGAIRDALRLKFDEDANRFLESIGEGDRTDEQLAEMHDVISAASLLRVAVDDTFGDAAKAGAERIRDGKRRYAESPQRIAAAVEGLVSGSPEREAAAVRVLLAAGSSSVGPLADAAARQTDPRRRDRVLAVLNRHGNDGLAALSQIALYGDDALRQGAIRALDRLSRGAAEPHWVAALHDARSDASLRQAAEQTLSDRFGEAPSPAEAEQYFVDRLARERVNLAHVADPDGPALLWSIDPDSRLPTSVATTRHLTAHRGLVDMTRLMHRLGELSIEARREGLAIDLAYRYRLDPFEFPEAWDELGALWGDQVIDVESISRILRTAIARDDLASAVAAMQRIGPDLAGETNRLLHVRAGDRSPLVDAVMHSVPQVRYEAAAAIGRLAYGKPFAGSSNVIRRWVEMASLNRDPLVLVVDTSAANRASIEQGVAQFGYQVEIVSSVAEAIRRLDEGGDLRLVISTSALPDRTVVELVDLIHRHPFGQRVPILIHGPESASSLSATRHPRGETPVLAIDLPVSAAGWNDVLLGVIDQPIGALRGLEPLSGPQRFDFRLQAIEAARLLAAQSGAGELHGLDGLETTVLPPLDGNDPEVLNEAFRDPQLALLSASSTDQAQASLVRRLLGTGQSELRYQRITEALIRSFDRSGVQLESAVIRELGSMRRSLPDGAQRAAITRIIETIAERFGVELTSRGEP
ncbi:MAG: hypothetical protein EA381_06955 [Planctomycetaceae bacterium]|nr:MAG: hypothetical protein EA381_06955 [Planctomycetaceae bacterium]